MKRIALLGAAGTGKTRLSHELAAHLRSRGLRASAVPEVLRGWCEREDRAPQPQELLAIAREQERQVDAAAATADLVLADTTALMFAIDAGTQPEDGELYRFALARQAQYDATLVMGLDLPWMAEGPHPTLAADRETVDALLRSLLQRAQVAYQVVYGEGPQRLQGALAALETAGVLPAGTAYRADAAEAKRWVWACEKCSDPACEHRLFAQLRDARG